MAEPCEVTLVTFAIGTKPKQRGTLRALGLRRIGSHQRRCPTVPRSAGWSPGSRTSSTVEEVVDEDPRPEAGARARSAPEAPRRARHRRQGRQDRRPRQQGPGRAQQRRAPASRVARRRCTAARRRRRASTNPFRVEYHVVNLDTLEAFDAGAEVDPGHPAGAGPRGQARPGQGARPGRAHRSRSPCGPTASRQRAVRAIEAAGGTDRGPPGSRGATGARRPEGTHSPTGSYTRLFLSSTGRSREARSMSGLSRLREHVPGPDLRNKILFTIFIIFDLPDRVAHPGAVRRLQRDPAAAERTSNNRRRGRLPRPVLRRRAHRASPSSSSGSCRTSRRRSSCSCSAS